MDAQTLQVLALSQHYTVPDRWQIYRWEVVNMETPNEAIMFTGAVCEATYKTGPRKGRPNFTKRERSTEMNLVLTRRQLGEFAEQWSAETGICNSCYGKGQTLASWSKDSGSKYRSCATCGGSGAYHPTA